MATSPGSSPKSSHTHHLCPELTSQTKTCTHHSKFSINYLMATPSVPVPRTPVRSNTIPIRATWREECGSQLSVAFNISYQCKILYFSLETQSAPQEIIILREAPWEKKCSGWKPLYSADRFDRRPPLMSHWTHLGNAKGDQDKPDILSTFKGASPWSGAQRKVHGTQHRYCHVLPEDVQVNDRPRYCSGPTDDFLFKI